MLLTTFRTRLHLQSWFRDVLVSGIFNADRSICLAKFFHHNSGSQDVPSIQLSDQTTVFKYDQSLMATVAKQAGNVFQQHVWSECDKAAAHQLTDGHIGVHVQKVCFEKLIIGNTTQQAALGIADANGVQSSCQNNLRGLSQCGRWGDTQRPTRHQVAYRNLHECVPFYCRVPDRTYSPYVGFRQPVPAVIR